MDGAIKIGQMRRKMRSRWEGGPLKKDWVSLWDSMQEYYLPDRKARFETLVSIVRAHNPEPGTILDLGCGTGTILLECLKAFPSVRVVGVDYDETLLSLARERLQNFGSRVTLIQRDMRLDNWTADLVPKLDAVLSATALHWFSAGELSALYSQVGLRLRPGGLFLNADHSASPDNGVQKHWKERMQSLRPPKGPGKEPWESFWEEYLGELGGEAKMKWEEIQTSRRGVEGGMPLDWHFRQLKTAGFREVDCFYRFCGDAIYGGIKG